MVINDRHAGILRILAESEGGTVLARDIAANMDVGTALHGLLYQMVDREWIELAGRQKRKGGTPLTSYRITDLGREAHRFAAAERSHGEHQ